MAKFPDWLYYLEKVEEPIHTTRVTGKLDAHAFIQHRPDYWIEGESRVLKKR